MKKILFVILSLFFVSIIGFAQAPPAITFEDTGNKPEKKAPARAGNFEIIQGTLIRPPINMEKFAEAANISLDVLNVSSGNSVIIHSQGTGFIHFRILRRPAWVDVRLCFWEDEYWFEYIESYRFDAVPAANQIHRNYGTFINRINSNIRRFYYQ